MDGILPSPALQATKVVGTQRLSGGAEPTLPAHCPKPSRCCARWQGVAPRLDCASAVSRDRRGRAPCRAFATLAMIVGKMLRAAGPAAPSETGAFGDCLPKTYLRRTRSRCRFSRPLGDPTGRPRHEISRPDNSSDTGSLCLRISSVSSRPAQFRAQPASALGFIGPPARSRAAPRVSGHVPRACQRCSTLDSSPLLRRCRVRRRSLCCSVLRR
jgi:hypothetical protein